MSYGMSNDVTQQLAQFADLQAFFDVVKNPDKYVDLVDRAEKTLATITELVGPYDTITKAKELETSINQYKVDSVKDIDAAYAELELNKQNFATEQADQRTKLSNAWTEYKSDKAQLTQDQNTLTTAQQQLSENQVQVNAAKQVNDSYRIELDKLKADLNDKAAKVKALLG